MDPRMMEMMKRLQGGVPQPAQQTGGMMPPGMAAPGGAQISAMNFTPRPATMGLDGMPIQRANDPQMLAQMQAMGLDGPRSPAQQMQYQQFMQQQPQMTPMGPMTPQQISSMTPDMRQQMNAMQNQADMQRRLASGDFPGAQGGMPAQRPMPGMSSPGGVQSMGELRAPVAPGDVLVRPPLPVGAGGKGTAAPGARPQVSPQPQMDPRVTNPPRPELPSTMTNNRRPMTQSQRTQAANPLFAQMMRGGSR
jgi:hypothetical protein